MRRLLMVLALALALVGLAHGETPGSSDMAYEEAGGVWTLPAASLSGADAFGAQAGKPALIVLFQPDCPWCQAQFRDAEIARQAKPGLHVLAVSLKGGRRDLIHELRRARTTIPAYKSSPALLEAFGRPVGTPRVFLISSRGEVLQERRGRQTAEALLAMIAEAE